MHLPTIEPEKTEVWKDASTRWLTSDERAAHGLRRGALATGVVYLLVIATTGSSTVNRFGNDPLLLLDGGWRILHGQMPYRDFYMAIGPLEYLLTALGMLLTHGSALGIGVGNALFGAVIGAWGWLLTRRRMPSVFALVATAWLVSMATSPTPIDSVPSILSSAMIYNRHGYALLGMVVLECAFAREQGSFSSGFSSGAATVLLAMLKLNFLGAAGLMLLATLPVRCKEMRREWGVVAGAGATLAAFGIYLAHALPQFFADMDIAVMARGTKLNFVRLAAEIPSSQAMMSLAVMTVAVTLLVWRGQLRERAAITNLLLGAAVIVSGALLAITNTNEGGCPLGTVWWIALAALLTTAFPKLKSRSTFLAVTALCLAPVAAEFALNAESMMTLLRFQLPGIRAQGAHLSGPGGNKLRYYEAPDTPPMQDNGPEYTAHMNDGVALLNQWTRPSESVQVVGFQNPFNYLLRRKPPQGGCIWLQDGNDISIAKGRVPEAGMVFGNADLVMEEHYANPHLANDIALQGLYSGYLGLHYQLVAKSADWSLYRRKE